MQNNLTPVELAAYDRIMNHEGDWKHKNGNFYSIVFIINTHADSDRKNEYPVTVVYYGEDVKVWSKPILEWIKNRTEWFGHDTSDTTNTPNLASGTNC